jgi:hypothetical protein
VVSALDSKIDDLYRQPLSTFVTARNALAKSLSGDEAKQVRALPKPTVVPWAVNQVYWRARSAYDRLMTSGERLRKAQIAALEGRSADVRAASDAHRHAIADAVREAERLAASSGSTPGTDALARTFESLSLATELPESPGRLTQALQPAGFEALAGVKPQPGVVRPFPPSLKLRRTAEALAEAGQPRADGRPATPVPHTSQAVEPALKTASSKRSNKDDERQRRAEEQRAARERERALAEARERQAAVKQTEAKVARAEAAEQQARAVWERAHDALLEARRSLAAVKSSK